MTYQDGRENMTNKIKEIFEISKSMPDYSEIVVWTHTFKAQGSLYSEKKVDGILTLTNVVIAEYFGDYDVDDEENCGCITETSKDEDCDCVTETTTCECVEGGNIVEWLNIFEDQIIAFSFVK